MSAILDENRSAPCPVCRREAAFAYPHPEARIYKCGHCSHVFSDPWSMSSQESYGPEYFSQIHRNWFEHPNIRLFRWIAAQIPVEATSLIDVGCGKGDFLRFVRRIRPDLKLVGIDLSENAPEAGIRFYQGDISSLDAGEKFDIVVSLAVIEHVADVMQFTKKLGTLCREAGQVIVMTVDNESLLYRVARTMNRLGFAAAFNRLYSTHHLHHFTSGSLRALLESNGIQVRRIHRTNAPFRSVDVPPSGRLVRHVLRIGVMGVLLLGRLTGTAYLQTAVGVRH